MSDLGGGKEESVIRICRILSIVFTVAFAIVAAVLLAVHSYGTAGLMFMLAGIFLLITVYVFGLPVSNLERKEGK